ncbi:MAG: bifunctional (p)ppGpp synthetase/guanosine-3',5'-bis(diphosphate) 3'-pyrophosphohydrolase [Candidatus Riflebacteria bacterium]|nr:bifunctional (p)ppGpp synthetase/guanosine-3',5'-bis(diphosphate) 3'-pyrophosphohydrolase [Candidatus Riflebacteria bacterium]
MSLEELIVAVKEYNPEADFPRIEEAYKFAQECHKDQFRASGESYFIHPEAVAMIVATELRLDSTSICAALLHDVVEDTAATLVDIETRFGATMAHLVEGVTKLNKMFFSSATAAQAVNFRKMLFAMTHDVRVILIKLADRLHNMRTLQFLPPVKQKYVAKETLDIYAPLAHRLGINKVKTQLEDLSFTFIRPDAVKEITDFLESKGFEGEAKLENAMSQIQEHLKEVNITVHISGRPKQIYSIWNKMQKYGIPLDGLYDILGIRILTRSVKDCYAALGIVHKFWKPIPGRFKDYIAVPKSNMYQSLHTTVIFDGKPLEVQIRTEEMHKISEEGIAAHWDYKETSGRESTPDYKEKLSWLRNLIDWYKDVKDASEFMETVKLELFQYHVYVFSPKGDVIELPQGSTPVDFGYVIHTDVGHRCIGAKVNGQLVPLDYTLQNGDIVSIVTSKNQKGPSRDWLKFVASTNAKKKIRAWLKKEFRADYIVQGEKEFFDLLSRLGGAKEEEKHVHSNLFDEEVRNLGFPSRDELFAGIGAGEVKPQQIINKIFPQFAEKAAEKLLTATIQTAREKEKDKGKRGKREPQIICGGIDSALVKVSKCCNPIPGDPIVGYITRGRGVTVHRGDCPNIKDLTKSDGRMMDVHWDMGIPLDQGKSSYITKIRLETTDRQGMLNSITGIISGVGINIFSANARTTKKNTGVLDFSIEVRDTNQLDNLLKSLSRLSGVTKVFRIDSKLKS